MIGRDGDFGETNPDGSGQPPDGYRPGDDVGLSLPPEAGLEDSRLVKPSEKSGPIGDEGFLLDEADDEPSEILPTKSDRPDNSDNSPTAPQDDQQNPEFARSLTDTMNEALRNGVRYVQEFGGTDPEATADIYERMQRIRELTEKLARLNGIEPNKPAEPPKTFTEALNFVPNAGASGDRQEGQIDGSERVDGSELGTYVSDILLNHLDNVKPISQDDYKAEAGWSFKYHFPKGSFMVCEFVERQGQPMVVVGHLKPDQSHPRGIFRRMLAYQVGEDGLVNCEDTPDMTQKLECQKLLRAINNSAIEPDEVPAPIYMSVQAIISEIQTRYTQPPRPVSRAEFEGLKALIERARE